MKTQTQSIIYAGTVITILLIIVLAMSNYNHLTSLNKQIDTINNNHNSKLVLLQKMSQIVHERSLRMFAMYFTEDAFERDKEFLRFHQLANEFIALRESLLEIGLHGEEKAEWEHAMSIIRVTEPMQDAIVERLYVDNEGMRSVISRDDLPKENELLSVFDKLIGHVQANSRQAVQEAQQRFEQAVNFLILMTALVIGLSLSVMFFVRKRILAVEASLHEQMELAQLTLQNIADGVIKTDASGKIISINPAAEHITEWHAGEALGREIDVILPAHESNADDVDLTRQCMQYLVGTAMPAQRYITIVRKSGQTCLIEKSVSPIFDRHGKLQEIAYIFRDVTSQKRQADAVSWQASHDPLTHVLNRTSIIDAIKESLILARRQRKQHALLYIDLDDFKRINDEFGHIAGDELLIGICREVEQCTRKGDRIARMGGDEFVVLLLDCDLGHAVNIAEKIRHQIAHYCFDFQGQQICCGGLSVGVGMVNAHSQDWKTALDAADQACYNAKRQGKNQVSVASTGVL